MTDAPAFDGDWPCDDDNIAREHLRELDEANETAHADFIKSRDEFLDAWRHGIVPMFGASPLANHVPGWR